MALRNASLYGVAAPVVDSAQVTAVRHAHTWTLLAPTPLTPTYRAVPGSPGLFWDIHRGLDLPSCQSRLAGPWATVSVTAGLAVLRDGGGQVIRVVDVDVMNIPAKSLRYARLGHLSDVLNVDRRALNEVAGDDERYWSCDRRAIDRAEDKRRLSVDEWRAKWEPDAPVPPPPPEPEPVTPEPCAPWVCQCGEPCDMTVCPDCGRDWNDF